MHQKFFFCVVLLTVGWGSFADLLAQDEGKAKGERNADSLVGTWDLSVRWGKDGDEKLVRHLLVVKSDLTGEIIDVDEGWANPIRNLKVTKQKVVFDFYYGENLGPFCMELFSGSETLQPHACDPEKIANHLCEEW